MKQLSDETIDQFITRLRQKADFCEFGDRLEENIRDQVIERCISYHLRRKLLDKGKDLTLKQLQTITRVLEASESKAFSIEHVKTEVNHMQVKRSTHLIKQGNSENSGVSNRCYRCYKVCHYQSSVDSLARD